jgi:hypothetical protein
MVTNVKRFESIIHGGEARPQPFVYNFAPPSAPKDAFVKAPNGARSLAALEKGGVAGQAEIAPPPSKFFPGVSRFRS